VGMWKIVWKIFPFLISIFRISIRRGSFHSFPRSCLFRFTLLLLPTATTSARSLRRSQADPVS
jgi:hypothetical protein